MFPSVPQARGTAMATIFNFRPAEPTVRDHPVRAHSGSCEIILFPGVRYERWEDTQLQQPAKAEAPKKSRAKKRALEMAD